MIWELCVDRFVSMTGIFNCRLQSRVHHSGSNSLLSEISVPHVNTPNTTVFGCFLGK